jgi:hypothetical protein
MDKRSSMQSPKKQIVYLLIWMCKNWFFVIYFSLWESLSLTFVYGHVGYILVVSQRPRHTLLRKIVFNFYEIFDDVVQSFTQAWLKLRM